MQAQRKSPASDTRLLQQMAEEIASMKALLMDLVIELKKTQASAQRLSNRVSELEKGTRDTPNTIPTATAPSGIQCSKVPDGVILYGKKIPLGKDTADVLYHLVCQDGIVTKERLATLCKPQNKLNKGEYIQTGSLYQRLRRLKMDLDDYHPDLGKSCILSIPRKEFAPNGTTTKQGGIANDYRFDAEAFRAILGIE